jgi:hypothetical protein
MMDNITTISNTNVLFADPASMRALSALADIDDDSVLYFAAEQYDDALSLSVWDGESATLPDGDDTLTIC